MSAQAHRGGLTYGQQVSYHHGISSMAKHWQPEIDCSLALGEQPRALSSVSSADSNYGYPSHAEQQALSRLKKYLVHVLAIWFELSRRGRYAYVPAAFLHLANINFRLAGCFRCISFSIAASGSYTKISPTV